MSDERAENSCDDTRFYVTVTVRFTDEVDELGLAFIEGMLAGLDSVTTAHADYAQTIQRRTIDAIHHAKEARRVRSR